MAYNIDFLRPFVIDPAILEWDLGSSASDLTKKVHDVFRVMKEDPACLNPGQIYDIIKDIDCQHRDPLYAMGHYERVAFINQYLVRTLKEKHPVLDLPSPDVAFSLGLVHDLSATYAKYDGTFTQEDKELTLYFHTKHLGIDLIADHAAMHATYWEILSMIAQGKGFEKVGLYQEWTDVLNDVGPFNYLHLQSQFQSFLDGKDNLSLLVLTVADLLETGKEGDLDTMLQRCPHGKDTIVENNLCHYFRERTNDLVRCHYSERIAQGKQPTAFGHSLINGGFQRVTGYMGIIYDLLHDQIDYRETRPGLWR